MTREAGTQARFERVLLLVLVAVTAGVWAVQFEPFALPNNDYSTFEATAESLAAGELPHRFQRMPILPGLMAALAPAMPGPHPYLRAALAWNFLFSLGLLVVLHLLAERTLGAGAILVPVLFAGTNQFHSMGLQPLVEPSLGFFLVAAFLLCRLRSPWQYAAAGAAALSRYEAAFALAALGLVNWLAERRFWRHLCLAVAGGLPFLAWLGAGALRGSGAAWYFEEVEGVGAAPHFLVTALREPLRGWWPDDPVSALAFAAAVGVPVALGVREGMRRFPRESFAMLLYVALSVATVVAFGIDKGRYAYATQWIPLLFLAAGLCLPLAASPSGLLGSLGRRTRIALLGAGACALLLLGALAVARMTADPHLPAVGLDLLWTAVALALAFASLLRAARTSGLPGTLAALAALPALLVAVPLLGAGMHTKAQEQYKIRWGNHGIVLAAAWARDHLAADERAVVLHKKHYVYRTGWPGDRFVSLGSLDAEDPGALAPEMRARGLTWLFATWRKPPAQPIDDVYERKYKWYLVDAFARGEPVAGFEHVASLALPEHLGLPPVQIYRVAPASDGR